ncbi:MAG: class IV adenylate cyclase [Bacteroidota bacterium]
MRAPSGSFLNIEIKARCADLALPRRVLRARGARFVGEDHQVDTYFKVPSGRLKLREGTVERALIYYQRPDQPGPKPSEVVLHPRPAPTLKLVLEAALDPLVVVDKYREIYYLGNVKIHLDRVTDLGLFVEVEAIDGAGTRDVERLRRQCEDLLEALGVREGDLESASYSDLLLAQSS